MTFPSSLQDLVLDGGAICMLFPYLHAYSHSGPDRHLRSLTLKQACIGTLHSVLRRLTDMAAGPRDSRPILAVDKLETNLRLKDLAEILESTRLHARSLRCSYAMSASRMPKDMFEDAAYFTENMQHFVDAQVQKLDVVFDIRKVKKPIAFTKDQIDHYRAKMLWVREGALVTWPLVVSLINKRGVLIQMD